MGCERVTDVQPHKHVADRWRALAELPALRDAPGEAFLSRKEVAALVGTRAHHAGAPGRKR